MDPKTGQSQLRINRKPNTNKRKKFYKAPRKFDLTTVFVVTFVCASAMGLMQAWQLPIPFQVGLAASFLVVGLIQMFASDSRARLAAIATGWVFVMLLIAINTYSTNRGLSAFEAAFVILCFGTLLGYCMGVLVAAVFLITDYVRIAYRSVFGGTSNEP